MASNYPLDKCHFCGEQLSNSPTREYPHKRHCLNQECGGKYQYYTTYNPPKWSVSFLIDRYYFQLIYTPTGQETGIIEYGDRHKGWDNIVSTTSVPEIRVITADNYASEINRIRMLQVYK